MNKYVVAYISSFDSELKQEIVEASSEVNALLWYISDWTRPDDLDTVEAIQQYIFDCDSAISVIAI